MQLSQSSLILGGGCFWCIEAAMQHQDGVNKVISGYAGGTAETANYGNVCSGMSGHAEVVFVEWDPTQVSLKQILDVFYTVHDPTTLNRQGNDIGTQYRSYIGYFDQNQLTEIEKYIASIEQSLTGSVTTELSHNPNFYKAEENHQNYYNDNSHQPYCQIVIKPKLEKLK